jgi:hypothetical protein
MCVVFYHVSRYALSTTTAAFRPTMMFQSRVFKFPLRNTSTTQLQYGNHLVFFSKKN